MTKTSSHSGQISMVDHHPYCGGSGTLNCWHQEAATFSGVWYTRLGMLATDSSGCVYTSSVPTKAITWTKQTALGCGLTNPQYDATGNLYALETGTGNLKFAEDQSGTWHQINGATAVQFSIPSNGEQFFAKINAAHALNTTTDPTHSWTANGSGYIYVRALSSQNWLLVKTNGTVWLSSHGTLTQIGTNSNAVQVNGTMQGDLNGNPMIYYLGSDGYVYHMNPSAPTGWDKLNGSGNTALAAGGPLQVMSLGGTGGTHLYRFGDLSPTISITYSANVNCNVPNPPGPSYCDQFHHSIYVTSCWGTQGCHTTNGSPWNGVGGGTVMATSDPQVDPIGCLDNPFGDGCGSSETGHLSCDGGGSDTQSNDFDYGVSQDVRRYIGEMDGPNGQAPQSVNLDGTAAAGTWKGEDFFNHIDACYSGFPTCPTSIPLRAFDNCNFYAPQWYVPCYEQVYNFVYTLHVADYGSPWVVITPWIEELSTGILLCAPDVVPIFPSFGNQANQPVCQ